VRLGFGDHGLGNLDTHFNPNTDSRMRTSQRTWLGCASAGGLQNVTNDHKRTADAAA
jgi:hypothetical protein